MNENSSSHVRLIEKVSLCLGVVFSAEAVGELVRVTTLNAKEKKKNGDESKSKSNRTRRSSSA